MANTLFETARNFFLNGTINFATGFGTGSGGIYAALMTYTVPTAGIKAVTGATVGATTVLTVTANGFANGDVVLVSGVGGTLSANGIFVVSAQATNTITLQDYLTGAAVVSTGETYTSGGVAINLGPSFGTWTSFSGAVIGTPVQVPTTAEAQGIASGAVTTFTAVSGAAVSAIALIATATAGAPASTDKMVAWIDGQMIVTCAAPLAAGTNLIVERLPAAIPNGTVLSFDDGSTATLTASPAQFQRFITVSSTTVAVNARATAPATGSGLPVTPNGGNIAITWDSVGLPGVSGGTAEHVGIFKL
jgi:hypothetical protein